MVTDPCAPVQRKGRGLKAEVVCLSHGDPASVQAQLSFEDEEREPLLFWRPGEYEVRGVFMRGIAMHAPANGAMRRNVAWLFHFGELNLLHPGALTQVPQQAVLETLGELHVLLLPLGVGRLTADEAAGLVALLEPRVIVPVPQSPSDGLDAALAGLPGAPGAGEAAQEEFLRVTAANLPEQTRVVLLQPKALPE